MFSPYHFVAESACFCPTSDEGRKCQTSEDCEATCLIEEDLCQTANEGQCSAWTPFEGCGCIIDLRFIPLATNATTSTTAKIICIN